MVITMSYGVRVIIFDLKRKTRFELSGFQDTNKLRLMPYFSLDKRPYVLTVRYDQVAIRNLQNLETQVRVRDNLSGSVEGLLEPLMDTREGVVLLRQDRDPGTDKVRLVLIRINVDYEYIVDNI
jgi:hypothetical protein